MTLGKGAFDARLAGDRISFSDLEAAITACRRRMTKGRRHARRHHADRAASRGVAADPGGHLK